MRLRLAVEAVVIVLAITGCVSIEQTREQLKSSNEAEVKKGEDTIYLVATTGQNSMGLVGYTTQERVEYVKLTSNQELLLRIIDNSDNGSVIEAAVEGIDFSKKGVAKSFVLNHFGKLARISDRYKRVYNESGTWEDVDVGLDVQKALKQKIMSHLTQAEILELVGDKYNPILRDNPVRSSRSRNASYVAHATVSYETRTLLWRHLVETTDDIDLLWKISQGEIKLDEFKYTAKNRLLTMLDKVADAQMAEKLLATNELVEKADQRIILMKKLPEARMLELALTDIKSHTLREWNDGNLAKIETGVAVATFVKDTKSVARLVTTVFSKIAGYQETCIDSWTMSWNKTDEAKVRELIAKLPKLSESVTAVLVCSADPFTWKYFIDGLSAESAYRILTLGKAKTGDLEMALIKKLPQEKMDMKVLDGVKSDAGKKAVVAAMPEDLKKEVLELNEKAFSVVMGKAKTAARETFELDGFYLGMEWNDMKTVLAHHFPDYKIDEHKDSDGDYVLSLPGQKSPFCYASSNGKVYQFNFGKKMLKKWYNYDVQAYREWAREYSRECKIDMRYKEIEKGATVYEPMDVSTSYRVWFHQESYQYKHNSRGYRLTYFGDERDFTAHDGIGGAVIKEAAASQFRYIRGDPGSLRATVEND